MYKFYVIFRTKLRIFKKIQESEHLKMIEMSVKLYDLTFCIKSRKLAILILHEDTSP